MPQEDAAALLNSFVPERTRWPDTALGVLSSEGVVAKRMSYQSGGTRLEMGFPYQVLGDTQICAAVLEQNRSTVEMVRSGHVVLDDDSPLRRWIQAAPVNFQQAMVVLYPEATGTELIDSLAPNAAAIINEPSDDYAPESVDLVRNLLSLMVETLPHRRPDSVTERTVELANLTLKYESWHLLWSSVFAVAAEPDHVLNADRLHTRLLAMPRAERDAEWIPMTWHILDDDTSPLLRLLRWAERTRTPDNLLPAPNAVPGAQAEPEVVRLAATVLTWLLSSSNRFIRDRTTKALVQLLLGHGMVLLGLLKRFLISDLERVDDGYLYERLLAVAYGWAMRVGSKQIAVTHELAAFVVEHVLSADAPLAKHPNVLSRDHAQGIVALAITHGYAPADDALIRPPFVSRLPANPPLEATLEERHPWKTEDATKSWGSLHSSIFSLGDFGNYEIEPAVRYISKIRRTGSQPSTQGPEDSHRLVPGKWKKFLASLNPQQVEQLDQLLNPQHVDQLEQDDPTSNALAMLEMLTEEQASLLAKSWTRIRAKPKTIDGVWAKRWVFQEVVRLGWTPERFNRIEEDLFRGRSYDRGSHKAERIGKKYQWLALRQLTARLLDNYYYGGHYGESDYIGAWQLGLRDLDPSLPPAYFRPPSAFLDEDESRNSGVPLSGSTFGDQQLAYFDAPTRSLPIDDKAEEWVEGTAELPSLASQLFRMNPSGRRWVALAEYVTHSDQSRTWEERHAEEWTHVYGWLTKATDTERLADYLESRTLMGRWMPEGGERTGSYLGEAGWALSWDDSENSDRLDAPAETVYFGRDRGEAVPREPDHSGHLDHELFVHPATHGYLWESTTSDCSIEHSVNVIIPADVLLETDQIKRHPDKPEWFIGPTSVAVNLDYASNSLRGSVLLVDEEWLASRLQDLGYGLVFGLLGERRRTGRGGVWREIDHIAHFDGTNWKFGAVRSTVKSPERE